MFNLTISFKLGSFNSTLEAYVFIAEYLHFKPDALYSNDSFLGGGYHDYDKEKIKGAFATGKDSLFKIADGVYNYSDEKNYLMYREDVSCAIQFFIFGFEKLNRIWLNHVMSAISGKGFEIALYSHSFKPLSQNEILPDQLKMLHPDSKFEYKMCWHPIWSNIYKKEVIDIFQNPGHSVLTYNTWLMAAPEMWYGKQAWEYFNKQRIKSFTQAIAIEEQENDTLYVKLFDADVVNYEAKTIMELQAAFREHSGMNSVEKELEAKQQELREAAKVANTAMIKRVYLDGDTEYAETVTIDLDKKMAYDIYKQLKSKYTAYNFEEIKDMHTYYEIHFQKQTEAGTLKFVIAINTNPFTIHKCPVEFFAIDEENFTDIKEYPEYEEILKDARKIKKGKSIIS